MSDPLVAQARHDVGQVIRGVEGNAATDTGLWVLTFVAGLGLCVWGLLSDVVAERLALLWPLPVGWLFCLALRTMSVSRVRREVLRADAMVEMAERGVRDDCQPRASWAQLDQ